MKVCVTERYDELNEAKLLECRAIQMECVAKEKLSRFSRLDSVPL